MSDAHRDALPEAVVETKSRLAFVWIIPVVAALVGVWLAYKTMSERGPLVSISFRTAEGLEAGKTKVKYRDLEMGVVETIELAEDLSHVVVHARLANEVEPYLREGTRFWVVRAQVSAGQVTGLGTLLSGAYVGMDPSREGRSRRAYEGLEVPPSVTSGDEGRLFVLRAPTLGSLEIGSPVYHRKFKVGKVVGYDFDAERELVFIQTFVYAPWDERVTKKTRFWNASGIDVSVDASGLRIDTESVVSMLIGGVSFDTIDGVGPAPRAEPEAVFDLYPNREATAARSYTVKQRYLVNFRGSVKGLAPGSPVLFKGITIGRVADVQLVFDAAAAEFRIPAVIEIEPERITVLGEEGSDLGKQWLGLVDRGLRAQLKTGNLLTGQLAVDLDLHPDAPPAEVAMGGQYPELPTIPTPLEEITGSLSRLVGRLERIPLEQMGRDVGESLTALRATLEQTKQLAETMNTDLAPAVTGAMAEAEKTLAGASALVGPDSAVSQELKRLLVELVEAARAIRLMADQLERHPEAVIFGKEGQQ